MLTCSKLLGLDSRVVHSFFVKITSLAEEYLPHVLSFFLLKDDMWERRHETLLISYYNYALSICL
jgi:hypothetical protein